MPFPYPPQLIYQGRGVFAAVQAASETGGFLPGVWIPDLGGFSYSWQADLPSGWGIQDLLDLYTYNDSPYLHGGELHDAGIYDESSTDALASSGGLYVDEAGRLYDDSGTQVGYVDANGAIVLVDPGGLVRVDPETGETSVESWTVVDEPDPWYQPPPLEEPEPFDPSDPMGGSGGAGPRWGWGRPVEPPPPSDLAGSTAHAQTRQPWAEALTAAHEAGGHPPAATHGDAGAFQPPSRAIEAPETDRAWSDNGSESFPSADGGFATDHPQAPSDQASNDTARTDDSNDRLERVGAPAPAADERHLVDTGLSVAAGDDTDEDLVPQPPSDLGPAVTAHDRIQAGLPVPDPGLALPNQATDVRSDTTIVTRFRLAGAGISEISRRLELVTQPGVGDDHVSHRREFWAGWVDDPALKHFAQGSRLGFAGGRFTRGLLRDDVIVGLHKVEAVLDIREGVELRPLELFEMDHRATPYGSTDTIYFVVHTSFAGSYLRDGVAQGRSAGKQEDFHPQVVEAGRILTLHDYPRLIVSPGSGTHEIDGTWQIYLGLYDDLGNKVEEWLARYRLHLTVDSDDPEQSGSVFTISTYPSWASYGVER